MNINEIISKYKFKNRPMGRIICKDGFSLSVQVGELMYCTPRSDKGPWNEVEVGFPSEKDDNLLPYAESPNKPENTVYPYVPIELVESVMLKHGGFDKMD